MSLTWNMKGWYKQGDGSFKGTILAIADGRFTVAMADIHVDNRAAGTALVEALQNAVNGLPMIDVVSN